MSLTRNILVLIGFLAVTFIAAGIGGLLTASGLGSWYDSLAKPAWNPPAWVFSPVWTTLYALMAVAAWWVWRQGRLQNISLLLPLTLFFIQLALNVAWSGLFFGLHMPSLAFFELLVLLLAILATTIAFFRVAPLAGYLMLPYLLWSTFAAALNFTIWRLNT